MKKLLLILSFILMKTSLINAQIVDSIKVEQAGDFIKVRYKILDSKPGQVYRVQVLCSIDGGLNTELRSITGDVGNEVMGGKPEYWVVWDVLKDVEELNSVEFIVRAEQVTDIASKDDVHKNYNFHVMASGQIFGLGYGARLGYMGKMGISGQFINARTDYINGLTTQIVISNLTRFSLDLTNRLVNSRNFQMHLLTGVTLGQAIIQDPDTPGEDDDKKFAPGMEFGLAICQRRTILALTFARLLPELTEEGDAITKISHVSLSYGIRF